MIQRSSLLTLTILVFAFACSKQGEGQHCSITNVNNDCDDGLECKSPPNSALACAPPSDNTNCLPALCCPPRPQHSNVEACNQYEYGVISAATGGSSSGGGSGITGVETGGSSSGGSATGIGGSATGGNSSANTEPDAGV